MSKKPAPRTPTSRKKQHAPDAQPTHNDLVKTIHESLSGYTLNEIHEALKATNDDLHAAVGLLTGAPDQAFVSRFNETLGVLAAYRTGTVDYADAKAAQTDLAKMVKEEIARIKAHRQERRNARKASKTGATRLRR